MQTREQVRYLSFHDEATLEALDVEMKQHVLEAGIIPIGALGFLKDLEHHQKTEFGSMVDFGEYFNKWRNYTVPEQDRWSGENRGDMPNNVTVLSFHDEALKTSMDRVTDLVSKIYGPEPEDQKAPYFREYQTNVKGVMGKVKEHFYANKTPDTFAVTLMRGALPFEQHFMVDDGRRLRVNAKRLDMETAHQGEKFGSMVFGLDNWEGLENVEEMMAKGEKIKLVFADDCISTGGSILAAAIDLHERYPGLVEEVSVYATVGEQMGIQEIIQRLESMGIKANVVVGDIAYSYNEKFYLQRAIGEALTDGTTYTENMATVGDMGDNMLEEKAHAA